MEHRVIEYSGCSYAHEPREFYLGDEHHVVRRVTNSWLEQTAGLEGLTRQIWRVIDREGAHFRLTYYQASDFWEIEGDTGPGV